MRDVVQTRSAALLLMVGTLAQTSCCTLIGDRMGRAADQVVAAHRHYPVGQASGWAPGSEMTATLQDGTIVKGELVRVRRLSMEEWRSRYTEQTSSPADLTRLPVPGDTVLVSLEKARGWARFAGFASTGAEAPGESRDEAAAVAIFEMGTDRVKMSVPLASLQRMQWPDSTASAGSDIARIAAGPVPLDASYLYVRRADTDTVAVPSWQVRRLMGGKSKTQETLLTLLGLVADITILVKVLSRFQLGPTD